MKRFAPLAMIVLLTGCGFHPLYGSSSGSKGGAATSAANVAELGQIRVDTIADRQGQELRNDLIDLINPGGQPDHPLYELSITYNETQIDLGLSNNAVTTRGQLTISLTYRLMDLTKNEIVTTGSSQEITEYNIQISEFATILSRDDAEDRALSALADNVATRLSFYFENLRTRPEVFEKKPAAQTPTTSIINAPPSQPYPNGVPTNGIWNETTGQGH